MAEVIIDQVRDGREQVRDQGAIIGLMIHRVGVNLKSGLVIGYDALSICDAFLGRVPQWKSVAKVTGGQNAYAFYIGGGVGPDYHDGKVWQALPIDEVGHHGLRFSASHVGIACIGDFRVTPPSAKQWHAAVDLCSDLGLLLGVKPSRVFGHGEVSEAHKGGKAPGQPDACPGDMWPMTTFRLEVANEMHAKMRQDAAWRLDAVGIRLP